MIILLKSDIGTNLGRLAQRRGEMPNTGDQIEFTSDRHTDKGPATGTITGWKTTVDGNYITVKFSDGQQMFSWDDLSPNARLTKSGLWMVKAILPEYALRQTAWRGLIVVVENEKGSLREGPRPDGTRWETVMAFPYGYAKDSEGVDGDEVDIYIGPDLETAEFVYVVHQRKVGDWKKYDEDKCMCGFLSEDAARAAFLASYDDPRFLGPITTLPVDAFVRKVKATRKKPAMIKALLFGPIVTP